MRTLAGLKNVLLFITNQCNLKCEYCYVQQDSQVMDLSLALKVIDNIDDGTVIDFFGGEPTLEIDMLQSIVDYAKDNGRQIVFQLFTNGTRFDDKVKKLIESGVNPGVSFDGLGSDLRNHNEHTTFKILENIKKLQKISPNIGVKCAITPQTVHYLSDNVRYCVNLGLKKISHFVLREDVWDDTSLKVFQEQLQQLIPYYINNFDVVNLGYFNGLIIENKREASCWAGREGVAINFNGHLYPCQRFLTNGSPFIIGNVDHGITNTIFKRYKIANLVGCPNCEIVNRCNNMCIACQWEHGTMLKPIDSVCKLTKILFKEIEPLQAIKDKIEERINNYKR
ncbi:MAG: radical SAM protein [Negativicutes bacterium]|nr:radical SAM protein [Negativicutes bacterium]